MVQPMTLLVRIVAPAISQSVQPLGIALRSVGSPHIEVRSAIERYRHDWTQADRPEAVTMSRMRLVSQRMAREIERLLCVPRRLPQRTARAAIHP